MDVNEYVEQLDKLQRLKDEGILSETEFNEQVNKIKREYSSMNNHQNFTYKTKDKSASALLIVFLILVILIFL